ncbi:MAG: hypothetical protein H0W04_03355, partial [Chthoniobacterales bacterium]|nr:hypothetical protein [Chthoniobacterales bacterium]
VFTPISTADRTFDFDSRLRQRLCARGFSEARTSALIPRQSAPFAQGAVELRNPLSEDHVALRPSLLPGLLAVLERNIRAGAQSVRLFELGRTFSAPDANEERHLALLCCGETQGEVHWRGDAKRPLDFFDLKGAVEAVETGALSFRRTKKKPGLALAAEIFDGVNVVGFGGQLTTAKAETLGAKTPVFILELQLAGELASNRGTVKFRELDKFPTVTRDIAMVVPDHLTHEKIISTFIDEPILERVKFFDLFVGPEAEKTLGACRKSMAYTLTYRDKNRTLTNDEVTVVHSRIRERLRSELGAELRE